MYFPLFYYRILYCTTVEPFNIIDAAFGGYITMNVLLYTLQILHILWSIMIFRVVIGKFTQGSVSSLHKLAKGRPPDKNAYWKTIFFISHPKHLLWVLKGPSQ